MPEEMHFLTLERSTCNQVYIKCIFVKCQELNSDFLIFLLRKYSLFKITIKSQTSWNLLLNIKLIEV